ncbi:hypothetical protein BpHYR1_008999 [Brachionus plicatilis]|uniref:Uncharacterized protein n=1 Tax=Brachionus plicatilis TaxID=10195 RepID=A0A3M7QEC4_BRAPC|nr:hypothetical protein BpHYR1_008999 [Brachionus plicatilis]
MLMCSHIFQFWETFKLSTSTIGELLAIDFIIGVTNFLAREALSLRNKLTNLNLFCRDIRERQLENQKCLHLILDFPWVWNPIWISVFEWSTLTEHCCILVTLRRALNSNLFLKHEISNFNLKVINEKLIIRKNSGFLFERICLLVVNHAFCKNFTIRARKKIKNKQTLVFLMSFLYVQIKLQGSTLRAIQNNLNRYDDWLCVWREGM